MDIGAPSEGIPSEVEHLGIDHLLGGEQPGSA
jgi:hypothetical protein